MKVATRTAFAKVEGYENTVGFTIKASAKAFGALIKGLYAHPIPSITRELSTNAWDSHIKAGNKDPFLVHLPSWAEPEWYIRDYGVGLSPEDIRKTYTVVFESDKTDSNDYTGCLGLGSKTPFAYSNNFTIESWINGTLYIYNAFIDNEGKPCIAILDENGTPSTEPNGIKITIAVKQADINSWIDAASKIYRYFTVKPTFINAKVNFANYNIIHSGKNWRIVESGGSAKVVMGNIAYPIKYEHVKNALVNHGVEIDCNIGDVNIEVSREGLHYDNKTVKFLQDILSEISAEISVGVQKDFDQCKSIWQANKFIVTNQHKLGTLANIIIPSLKFKGQPFHPTSSYRVSDFDMYGLNYNGNITRRNRWSLTVGTGTTIIEALPKDKKANAKIKHSYSGRDIYIFRIEDAALRQKLVDQLGLIEDDIIKSDTLPDAPPTVYTGTRKKLSKISTLNNLCTYMSSSWDTIELDIDKDGGIFVETQKFKWKRGQDWYNPLTLCRHKDMIKGAGIKLDLIYGIRSSIINKVEKLGHWTHFDDFVKNEVKNKVVAKNWDQLSHYWSFKPNWWSQKDMLKLLNSINNTCHLGKHKKELIEAFSFDKSVIDNMIKLNSTFNLGAPSKAIGANPLDRYKLLPDNLNSGNQDLWTQLVNYINSI